jgi:hypothetical protein
MVTRKKLLALAASVATAMVFHSSVATPAFPQSIPQPTITSRDNQNSTLTTTEVTRTVLIGGVAAVSLTALGLATALLSGKNNEELEVQIKRVREVANVAAKSSPMSIGYYASIPEESIDKNEECLRDLAGQLIRSYHTQALAQATAQFWFSVTAASIGFLVIMYTCFSSVRFRDPYVTLLNTIPGIAIEAVAALFFRQAEDTRKRATALYDRLRLDDRQLQAINLLESIQNKELRDIVKAHWALHIAGLEAQPMDLSSYLPQITHIQSDTIYSNGETQVSPRK